MIKIVRADGKSEYEFLEANRTRAGESDARVEAVVREVLEKIRNEGDSALNAYCRRFDGVDCVVRLDRQQIKEAYDSADDALKRALLAAKKNIAEFHSRQLGRGFELKRSGCVLGQKVRGLERVGIYVPGGTAAYPSSVLMNAVPARIAGVEEIVMATPPGKDGSANRDILTAAYIADVDCVYLMGGAQAVGALAYGTETIDRVDKIVGPGNAYVATAKRLVYGVCDIDMIAGPSEILILADESADPAYVAADLMSQAEHDRLASATLLTTSEAVAQGTIEELNRQIVGLERREIIESSLQNYGGIILCRHADKMIELANYIAPEHLEVMTEEPMRYLDSLTNAGSIFLGQSSPEPLGDYLAGPNHVLPTSGTARFFSPLSVDDFVKKTQYICYSRDALLEVADEIVVIADREGLTAHANSILVRKGKQVKE